MTDIGDEMEMATQSAQARLKRADPKRTRPDRVRGLPSCPRPSAAPPTIGAFFMMTKPASSRCWTRRSAVTVAVYSSASWTGFRP